MRKDEVVIRKSPHTHIKKKKKIHIMKFFTHFATQIRMKGQKTCQEDVNKHSFCSSINLFRDNFKPRGKLEG